MATLELYPLLDLVLSSDPQDLSNSEKEVTRLSYHLRSADVKDAPAIRAYIQNGISSHNYNRKNSELVLMYLENALKGSASSLRLFTKVTHRSGKRRDEGEEGRRRTRRKDRPRGDADRDSTPWETPSETSMRESENSGEETERTEKRTLDSLFQDIDPEGRNWRLTNKHKVSIIRVALSNLEKVRRALLTFSFTRILMQKWQHHVTATQSHHVSAMRAEVCKRLIAQYRKAAAYQKANKLAAWKSHTLSTQGSVRTAMIKLLLRNSSVSFQYRKREAWEVWKASGQRPSPVSALPAGLNAGGVSSSSLTAAVLNSLFRAFRRHFRGHWNRWRRGQPVPPPARRNYKSPAVQRLVKLAAVLSRNSKAQKQAIHRWKALTFVPQRLFPSLDEYKVAMNCIIGRLYRPAMDFVRKWEMWVGVDKSGERQRKTIAMVEVLQRVYRLRVMKCIQRPPGHHRHKEAEKGSERMAIFGHRFAAIGHKAAARVIAEAYQQLKSILILTKSRRQSVVRRVISMAQRRTLKAFLVWKGRKAQESGVGEAWRYMRAAELIEKVGRRRMAKPLRCVVGLYPIVRSICNRINNANSCRLSRGLSVWQLNASHHKQQEPDQRTRRFLSHLRELSRSALNPPFRLLLRQRVPRINAAVCILTATKQRCLCAAFQQLRAVDRWAAYRRYCALLLQQKLIAATHNERKSLYKHVVASINKLQTAVRAFVTRLQSSQRVAVNRWKQSLIKQTAETAESVAKAQKLTRTLEKVARKPLRSGLLQKPKKTTVEMGLKTSIPLEAVTKRTLKTAFDRIIGKHYGNLQLKNVFLKLRNPLKFSIKTWVESVNIGKMQDLSANMKAEKLRNSLSSIPLRLENDGFQRLIKGKNRYNEALATMIKGMEKPSRSGIKRWRIAVELKKIGEIERQLKGERLQQVLKHTVKGAVFSVVSCALIHPKQENGRNTKASKMTKVLESLGKKEVSFAYRKIAGNKPLLRKSLMTLFPLLRAQPKTAFSLWRNYISLQTAKRERLQSLGSRLVRLLFKPASHTYKSAITQLLSLKQQAKQQKSALRRVFIGLQRDRQEAIGRWKVAVWRKESEDAVGQYRPPSALRFSVKRTMPTSPSNSSSRDDYFSIITEHDSVMAARLSAMVQIFKNMPRLAISKWKASTTKPKANPAAPKLQNTTGVLIRMIRRQIRTRKARSKSQPEIGQLFNKLQAEQVRNRLNLVVIPQLKKLFERLTSGQITLKRAVRVIVFRLSVGLKKVLKNWKWWVETAKVGGNVDLLRGQKLRELLHLIPVAKVRAGFERVATHGDRVKKAVKAIVFSFNNARRSNLQVWSRNAQLSYQKEVDNRVAYRLLHDVDALFVRNKRAAFTCIKAEHHKERFDTEGSRRFDDSEKGALNASLLRLFSPVSKTVNCAFRAIFASSRVRTAVGRLKAVHRLLRLAAKFSSDDLQPALSRWKEFNSLRTLKLKKRGVYSFIYTTKPSLETSFWRWKIVKDYGEFIFPHQFTFLRHTARVLDRVQSKFLSKSLLLLRINQRQCGQQPARSRSPPLHFLRQSAPVSQKSSITDEEEFVTPETIPRIVENKLNGVEVSMVKRLGAVETLGLKLRTVLARNAAYAFASVKDEGELRELRECNDMLMDDLTKLQQGNERLMETFQESTHNLEILSNKLNILKTERVVRVLEKVSAQLPQLEAFLVLKLNAGLPLSD